MSDRYQMKNKKINYDIPKAAMWRLMKRANAERISDKACEILASHLEELGISVGKYAKEIADTEHETRSKGRAATIKQRHIDLAWKFFLREIK